MSEKNAINGKVFPMEDYGTIRGGSTRGDEDRVNILSDDELERDGSTEDGVMMRRTTDDHMDRGCYFRDGKRKIDFMLAYEDSTEESATSPGSSQPTGDVTKSPKSKASIRLRHNAWRQKFLTNIKKCGVEIEEESVKGKNTTVYFFKLHCPWDTLCYYAEDMGIRAPLQAHPNPSSNWSGKILKIIKIPNIMDHDVPNQPLDYYTCPFKKSKLSRFLGSDNHDTYFENRDRHRIAYEILATAPYGKRKRAEIGIERLLEEEVYTAAYPLHDGGYELPENNDKSHDQLNNRQILYEYWARWGVWYKYQPLDHIREYFGEKIGIYFAWLGFYTAWLLPASLIGLFVFMYGVFTMNNYNPAKEICDSGEGFKMCPLCDENIGCQYWYLSDVCLFTKLSYLFDQPGTVFYAVFVSFWAVTFLEYWKRKNASLAHHWDCLGFEEEEERPRPLYAAMAPTMEKNPITGVKEPHFPQRDRIPRLISGIAVVVIMMVLVVIFIIAVIMYRILVSIPLFQSREFRSQASTIASLSAAIVNLILIMALGKVYEKLALKLTQWEMHRTQTEFEDQLIFKVFIFQFVNFYSSIIYIGFFKGRFVGYPGHYTHFFGLRNEECQNGGCLIELAMQLGVIMIGKQAINNAQELFVPKLRTFIHQWQLKDVIGVSEDKERWEEDYELIDNEGLFEEYLEMVLQFGFITIFVAAFPLAPLFALINNWIEVRLDAHKFVCETRRPVAERAEDIGVWFTILDALAQLAVISNAFLIAFTSEFLPRLLYQYRYNWDLLGYVNYTLAWAPNGTLTEPCRYKDFRDNEGTPTTFYWELLTIRLLFVIVFEHIVFGVCRLIDIMVPDVPESLELKIKRERYLAKQALADAEALQMRAELDDEDITLDVPSKA